MAFMAKRYSSVNTAMIEDYEGMTFWLALNVYDLLPGKWQTKYPKCLSPLGVSVGHSAKGIAENVFGGQREVFLGLDLDLRKIPLGRNNLFLKFLTSELNFVRLPMPAIRITPGGKWYGIYF